MEKNYNYSNKIKWLSGVYAFLVIMIHTNSYLITFADSFKDIFPHKAQVIANMMMIICNIAVPSFFMFSGFLFFKDARNIDLSNIKNFVGYFYKKFKSRIFTLLIPYILWCCIIFIIAHFVAIIQGRLTGAQIFDYSSFNTYLLMSKHYLVLWYLRDLIIFTLFTPIIYICMKNKFTGIIFIFFAGLINSSLYIYLIGCFVGIWYADKIEKRVPVYIRNIGIIVLMIILSILIFERELLVQYSVIYTTIIPIAAWCALDWGTWNKKVPDVFKNSFFIYTCHYYIYSKVCELLCKLFLYDKYSSIVIYLIAPVITLVLCWGISKILRRYFKDTWKALVGR